MSTSKDFSSLPPRTRLRRSKLITRKQLYMLSGGKGGCNPLKLGTPILFTGGKSFATKDKVVQHITIKEEMNEALPKWDTREENQNDSRSDNKEVLYHIHKVGNSFEGSIVQTLDHQLKKKGETLAPVPLFWEPVNGQPEHGHKKIQYVGHWSVKEVQGKTFSYKGCQRCGTIVMKLAEYRKDYHEVIEEAVKGENPSTDLDTDAKSGKSESSLSDDHDMNEEDSEKVAVNPDVVPNEIYSSRSKRKVPHADNSSTGGGSNNKRARPYAMRAARRSINYNEDEEAHGKVDYQGTHDNITVEEDNDDSKPAATPRRQLTTDQNASETRGHRSLPKDSRHVTPTTNQPDHTNDQNDEDDDKPPKASRRGRNKSSGSAVTGVDASTSGTRDDPICCDDEDVEIPNLDGQETANAATVPSSVTVRSDAVAMKLSLEYYTAKDVSDLIRQKGPTFHGLADAFLDFDVNGSWIADELRKGDEHFTGVFLLHTVGGVMMDETGAAKIEKELFRFSVLHTFKSVLQKPGVV